MAKEQEEALKIVIELMPWAVQSTLDASITIPIKISKFSNFINENQNALVCASEYKSRTSASSAASCLA
jgi:hypothetical protein